MTSDQNQTGTPDVEDVRFAAYADDELTEAECDQFEAELDADPRLQAAFDAYMETVSLVRNLKTSLAPEEFVDHVEDTIRARSRGRFFARDLFAKTRVPYEVFAALMIGLLASLYLYGTPKTRNMGDGVPDQSDVGASTDAGTDGAKSGAHGRGERPAPIPRRGAAREGAVPTDVPVAPIAHSTTAYTITVDPAKASLEDLGKQIASTDRRYHISRTDGGLRVEVPDGAVKAFLAAFGRGRPLDVAKAAPVTPGMSVVRFVSKPESVRGADGGR